MPQSDFYKLLGVKRDATEDEIRTSYRKLARKYHPDVSKSPDAQTRFTEVQEAYDVLSDAKKRRLYDVGGFGAGGVGGGQRDPSYTWSNVGGGQGVGMDFDQDDLGSMFESFFGASNAGMGPDPRTRPPRSRPRRRGRNVEHPITIPFVRAIEGGTEQIRVARGTSSQTIDLKIPAGIADGSKLRVPGRGEEGVGKAPPGDLILVVAVASHELYRRDVAAPLNLNLTLPLTIAEATLGSRITLPTPRSNVELTIPPGTSGGAKLRVRGRGIETATAKGDLIVSIQIIVPQGGENDEIESAARTLGDATADPRSGPAWS